MHSSDTLVTHSTIAPAARSAATAAASRSAGGSRRRAARPAVLGMPATAKASLTLTGTPSSGGSSPAPPPPLVAARQAIRRASAAAASSRAAQKRSATAALRAGLIAAICEMKVCGDEVWRGRLMGKLRGTESDVCGDGGSYLDQLARGDVPTAQQCGELLCWEVQESRSFGLYRFVDIELDFTSWTDQHWLVEGEGEERNDQCRELECHTVDKRQCKQQWGAKKGCPLWRKDRYDQIKNALLHRREGWIAALDFRLCNEKSVRAIQSSINKLTTASPSAPYDDLDILWTMKVNK
jgi:hypothetical protein